MDAIKTQGNFLAFGPEGERIAAFALQRDRDLFLAMKEVAEERDRLREVNAQLVAALRVVREDIGMFLSGEWDGDQEGWRCTRDGINEVLGEALSESGAFQGVVDLALEEPQHTPTPWKVNKSMSMGQPLLEISSDEHIFWIAGVGAPDEDRQLAEANAAFIVRSCNSHEALVGACEAARPDLVAYSNSYGGDYLASLQAVDAALALAREEEAIP